MYTLQIWFCLHGGAGYLGVEKPEVMPQNIYYLINIRPSRIKNLTRSNRMPQKNFNIQNHQLELTLSNLSLIQGKSENLQTYSTVKR